MIYSTEAEQAVLGAILIDDKMLGKISEVVQAEYFYNKGHQQVFDCMLTLARNKKPIDLITLSDMHELTKFDVDIAYLGTLARNTPSTVNALSYADIVLQKYYGRMLCESAINAHEQSKEIDADFKEIRKTLYTRLEGLFSEKGHNTISNAEESIEGFIAELESACSGEDSGGWSTGDYHIDEMTGGFMPGDYITIAARSGGGKTTHALNIFTHFAMNDRRCLAFSMETKRSKLVMKMVSNVANIPFSNMRKGEMRDEDWGLAARAAEILKSKPFHIDDSSGLSIDDIENKARELKAKYGQLDLIMVDYVQRIKIDPNNRYSELTDASNRLKNLFMELDCCGLVLAQLKKNSIKEPNASDLRETGSIENDSDVIIFLHTPSGDLKPHKDMLTWEIFNKVRDGETGVKMLNNQLQYQRFSPSNEEWQEPQEERF